MIADPLWSCVMLLCGPLRYLVIPAIMPCSFALSAKPGDLRRYFRSFAAATSGCESYKVSLHLGILRDPANLINDETRRMSRECPVNNGRSTAALSLRKVSFLSLDRMKIRPSAETTSSVIFPGRLKMRDMKMRDQFAGVENAGKVSMESQSVKKCLKVVAICVQSYSFSISLLDR